MVSQLPRDGGSVLDVATGTGSRRASGCSHRGHRVTGLDQSPDMLAVARRRFGGRGRARRGVGHRAPLRRRLVRPPHVHLPAALRRRSRPRRCAELARVVRPGGTIAIARVLRAARDLAAALGSLRRRRPARCRPPDLARAGTRSAASSARRSAASTSGCRSSASSSSGARPGSRDVRARRMSLGGGVVIWGAHESGDGEAGVLRAAAGAAGGTT